MLLMWNKHLLIIYPNIEISPKCVWCVMCVMYVKFKWQINRYDRHGVECQQQLKC